MTDHDCPWTGECRCVRDGSLCTCGHQKADHEHENVFTIDMVLDCRICGCQEFGAVS